MKSFPVFSKILKKQTHKHFTKGDNSKNVNKSKRATTRYIYPTKRSRIMPSGRERGQERYYRHVNKIKSWNDFDRFYL